MGRKANFDEPSVRRQFRLTDSAYKGLHELSKIAGVSLPKVLVAIGTRDPAAYIWLTKFFTQPLDD